ncbi:hypothetical protein QO179_23835 [Bacillus stercoris]|nr:hypothetical protein [Bacillus stercoris]
MVITKSEFEKMLERHAYSKLVVRYEHESYDPNAITAIAIDEDIYSFESSETGEIVEGDASVHIGSFTMEPIENKKDHYKIGFIQHNFNAFTYANKDKIKEFLSFLDYEIHMDEKIVFSFKRPIEFSEENDEFKEEVCYPEKMIEISD